MTTKERLELNKEGLKNEYKTLNTLLYSGKGYEMEVNARMCDIANILINKYHMTPAEIETLEA